MKLKERIMLALMIGSLITLIFWSLFTFLLILGKDIILYDYIRAGVMFFGASFITVFICFPIVEWILEKFIWKNKKDKNDNTN